MKRIICSLIFFSIYSTIFSQTLINETILDNFYEYRSDITEYFSYYFREDYSGEMLYYNSRLMTIFGSIIDRKMISDEIIDLIIDLFKETISLKPPYEDKEMYIEAGLGENGHEFYTKILSIMYFMDLEENMNNFPIENRRVLRNSIDKLKNLFNPQDWAITVNFFKRKYGR